LTRVVVDLLSLAVPPRRGRWSASECEPSECASHALTPLVGNLLEKDGKQPATSQTKQQSQKPAPNAIQQLLEALSDQKKQQDKTGGKANAP